MSAETVTRTIQLILAPVVMVSACAIFVSGLLSHYEAINARMRTLTRERLDLLRSSDASKRLIDERLFGVDVQLPQLLRRHELVHHALLAAYTGILILVTSMCAIAFSAVSDSEWLVTLVLTLFVLGVLAMLVSVVWIALEVRTSQRTVAFEVQSVLGLRQPSEGVTRIDLVETVHP